MKKLLLLLGLIPALSMAQNNLGVFGNLSLSTSSSSGAQTKAGGGFGMLYDINVAENLSVQPRLMLSYQEYERKQASMRQGLYQSPYYSQWNVTVPVLASYKFRLSDALNLRIGAGPYIQYAAFGRNKTLTTGGEKLGWWHESFGQHLSFGLQGGLELDYGRWFLLVDGSHSLVKRKITLDGHATTTSLSIGYRL